ncbi:MAG: AMP-binding protein, partial [Anaerolineales bacterium]
MSSEANIPTKAWLQFYDQGVPYSIEYPPIPLDKLLKQSAEKHPDQRAILFGGSLGSRVMDRSLSYRELDDAVDRFAAAMQVLGIKKRDRVAIFMPNCPQFVIAYYGTMRAGGIAVPCNPLYTAKEITHQLNDAGAQIIVTLSLYYNMLNSVRSDTKLRHIIVTNIKEYFPPLLKILFTVAKEKKDGHAAKIANSDDLWFQSLLNMAGKPPEP